MTEQEIVATPVEPAQTSASRKKNEKKSKPQKSASASAKKSMPTSTSQTDDQKREARNAALREWRKKNKEKYAAYMADWRAKRKGEQPAAYEASATTANTVQRKGTTAAAKKPDSKTAKKGGKA